MSVDSELIETDTTPQPSQERSTDRRDEKALQIILRQNWSLYVNTVGEPMVKLHGDSIEMVRQDWPLSHDRVRTEISTIIWEHEQIVLYDHEVNRILTVLRGHAWRNPKVDRELTNAMDADPLFEAVVIYLGLPEIDGNFHGRSTKLLKELTTKGRMYGVDTNGPGWPKGSAQLSRRLGELTPLFRQFEIQFTRGRNSAHARFIELKRAVTRDDASGPASPSLSEDKLHHPKQLRSRDADDDRAAAIFSRIRSNAEGSDE